MSCSHVTRRLALAALALAAAAAAPLAPADAQDARSRSLREITASGGDSAVRIVPRRALGDADEWMVSRDGGTALLLRDDRLLVQLTDAGLHELGRETRRAGEDEQGVGARLIASLVGGMVRSLMDHALAYDLADLADARWADGRLVLTRRSGEPVFDRVEVNGRQLLEGFEPAEARAFAARLRSAAAEARRARR